MTPSIAFNKTLETPAQKPAAWTVQKDRSREVKIQQIAAVALASIAAIFAMVSTVLAMAVSPIFLLPAALSIAAAVGGILWYQSIVDYDDPRVVEQLRKEMENMCLCKIMTKHGLENTCKVLSKEEFYDKFVAHTKDVSFPEVFQDYKKIKARLEKLGVKEFPMPEQLKEKLKKETAGSSLRCLLGNYAAQELFKYNLLDSSYRDKYLKETSDLDCKEIASRYPVAIFYKHGLIEKAEYEILEKAIADEKQLALEIAQHRDHFKKEVAQLEKEREEKIKEAQERFKRLDIADKKTELQRQENREYCCGRYSSDEIRQIYSHLFKAISLREQALEKAIGHTMFSVAAECETKIAIMRKQADEKIAHCQEAHKQKLSELNQQYRDLSQQTPNEEASA